MNLQCTSFQLFLHLKKYNLTFLKLNLWQHLTITGIQHDLLLTVYTENKPHLVSSFKEGNYESNVLIFSINKTRKKK